MWKEHWQQFASSGGNSTAEDAIASDSFSSIWAKVWEAKKTNKAEVLANDLKLDPNASDIDLDATDGLEREVNGRSGYIGAAIESLPPTTNPPIGLSSSGPTAQSR
jgi:hypothetical protein